MTVREKEAEKTEPLIHILEVAGNAITGGMEQYVYNLARHLPGRGFKVTCLTPYESPFTARLRDLGLEVFITAMNDDPAWRSIQFTTELINHQRVDVLHAHLPRAHMLAGLVGRLTDTPVAATVHGMEVTGHELGIARTTGTNLIVVCQEAYTQALSLGVPEERLSLILNGVDLDTFKPQGSGTRFRRALHIPESAPLVGFVGRFAWEKGPDQFVLLAEHVLKERQDAHFVMVGEGPNQDEIQQRIKRAGLTASIHLIGLIQNTWEVYNALDVLAQTSRVEGMPFALLEAMACETPVVAMAVGGVPEIIEVSTTGYLSAGGDWAGAGDAVLKLLANPEKAKWMGRAARRRVETHFDLQSTVGRLAALFRRLVAEKRSQGSFVEPAWPVIRREQEPVEQNINPDFFKGK